MTMSPTGATILKSIHLDNAAIKIFVNIPEVQNDEVGLAVEFEGSRKADCDEDPPSDDRGWVSNCEHSSIGSVGKGGRQSCVHIA